MKMLITVLMMHFIPGATILAQSKDSISVPEFLNSFQILSEGNELIPLEKQKAFGETKGGASTAVIGIGKTTNKNVVKLANSPVQLEDITSIKLIVRLRDTNVEPMQLINVFQLVSDKKKNRRLVEVARSNAVGTVKMMDIPFIPFEYKKYKEDCLIIQLKDLEPGEYAITLSEARDIFQMFSIVSK